LVIITPPDARPATAAFPSSSSPERPVAATLQRNPGPVARDDVTGPLGRPQNADRAPRSCGV
jgi:hypothetical protein